MILLYVSALSDPQGDPIAGLHAALFTAGGMQVSTDLTDAYGAAYLGQQPAGDYELRFTAPLGAMLVSPARQTLTLADADSPAVVVDVKVNLAGISVPTSPRICRCAGQFVDPAGRPFADAVLTFSEADVPQLLYDASTDVTAAVLPRTVTCRTDRLGYGTVDLIRGAQYAAMVGPFANVLLTIVVPDTPTASLPDVLFPVVDRVEYTLNDSVVTPVAAPTLEMTVGGVKTLSLETVYRSGYRVVGLHRHRLVNPDDSIINIQLTDPANIVITALAAGAVTLGVERIDAEATGVNISPLPPIKGSLAVTVVS